MHSGLLNVGDIIKEIDGQEVTDPDVLTEMMRKAQGSITFKIIPSYAGQSSRAHVSFTGQSSCAHVSYACQSSRAHVSYARQSSRAHVRQRSFSHLVLL